MGDRGRLEREHDVRKLRALATAREVHRASRTRWVAILRVQARGRLVRVRRLANENGRTPRTLTPVEAGAAGAALEAVSQHPEQRELIVAAFATPIRAAPERAFLELEPVARRGVADRQHRHR